MSLVDNTFRDRDYEDLAAILGKSMFPLLKENEGIFVHFDDDGFLVCKVFDEDHQEWQVKVIQDDDALQHPDLQLVWIHDKPMYPH